ncbi:MAG: c-type cytochrome [Planctomycetaceae bacterium]|nr:c-type cytochrome [Planctomycetaceae bacterium]
MSARYLLLIFVFATTSIATEPTGLQVPDGFVVTRYADDQLAHDVYSMTINAEGQVVVSGPGYVRTLLDQDQDGVADSFRQFSAVPSRGAHGMVFDGADLICTGDNSLMKIRDLDGDGVGDTSPEIWARLRNPEHGANGLIQGPDGWFYLICGNDAGVTANHAQTPKSPIHQPRSGTLLRFSPDGATSEVVAEGFRNPYDLSINRFGHWFTVDADGERDHHLPWYTPTRLFDIAEGEHHGWVNNGWKLSWSRPVSFFDNVDRVAELGRGSPTGLTVYSHTQFPPHYQNGIFSCCWTLGRVYFIPLEIVGTTYRGEPELFLQTVDDVGFAPVDIAVGPSGDLFVAIGGRGTQGGVFRIRSQSDGRSLTDSSKVARILNADQPLAAWSRAAWKPLAEQLGPTAFESAAMDEKYSLGQRIRAIEILVELFDGLPPEVALKLVKPDNPPEITARAAWAIGRRLTNEADLHTLTSLAESEHPRIVRAALEPLASQTTNDASAQRPEITPTLLSTDRRIRNLWIRWLATNVRAPGLEDQQVTARVLQRRNETMPFPISVLFDNPSTENSRLLRLELLRLLQLQLGDINVSENSKTGMVGYSRAGQDKMNEADRKACELFLLRVFPTNDSSINQEIARVASMLALSDPRWPSRFVAQCSPDSEVESDIHYLMALTHVSGKRSVGVTEKTAEILLNLSRKMAADKKLPSRNWPLRIADTYRRLCEQDSRLATSLIKHHNFRDAEHSLFVLNSNPEVRQQAAENLLRGIQNFDDDQWDPELIRVVSLLPDERSFPILRDQWSGYHLRDAIIEIITRSPQDIDHKLFVEALQSARPTTVARAAIALSKLSSNHSPGDLATTMSSLQRHCSANQYTATRKALRDLLFHWTGEPLPVNDHRLEDEKVLEVHAPYFKWFRNHYPEQAAELRGFPDQATWTHRLNNLNWTKGEPSRGKQVYQRLQCAACHSGKRRLGPDIHAVTKRFSREDLFAAILNPNQSVSPLYQTKRFETRGGRVYSGMIVYESPNGTLLQLGPDEVVRIADDEVIAVSDSPTSLMPSGLLRNTTDQDLVDLYAFLQQMANP